MLAASGQLEWLIIVLVYNHQYIDSINLGRAGYIPMEVQKNNLIQAIKDIKFNEKVKVIVVENRLHFAKANEEIVVGETATILESASHGNLQTALIATPTHELLSTRTGVKSLLINLITKKENLANRHIVITFGHGSIFGINYIVSPQSLQSNTRLLQETASPSANTDSFLEAAIPNSGSHSFAKLKSGEKESYEKSSGFDLATFFGTYSKKELKEKLVSVSKEVMLTNEELRDAIKEVLKAAGKRKLDILVMYNCIMQNVYTQYALKDCVEFLVAPVSGICQPGYNYSKILADLMASPAQATEDAAGLFISTIKDLTENKESERDINGTWKICSVQLESAVYSALKANFTALIKQMNALLDGSSPSLVTCLDSTLNQCFNYAIYCLNNQQSQPDLYVFLKYLLEKINTDFNVSLGMLIPLIEQLLNDLKKIKVRSFIGERIFNGASFADQRYEEAFGFGFLIQRIKYPDQSIQHDTLASAASPYFPSFLTGTGFEKLFSSYAGNRNSGLIDTD